MFYQYLGIIRSFAFPFQAAVVILSLMIILPGEWNQLGTKKKYITIALVFLATLAAYYVVSLAVFCLLHLITYQNLWHVFSTLIVYSLYALTVCKKDFKIRVLLFASFYCVFRIVTDAGGLLSYILFEYIDTQILQTLLLAFVILDVVIIKKFNLFRYDYVDNWLFVISLIFDAVVITLASINSIVTTYFTSPNWYHETVAIFTYFILLLVYIITYYVVKTTHDNQLLFREKTMARANASAAELIQQKNEEFHCLRHDLRNQFGYMSTLIEEGKYEEAKNHFVEMEERFDANDTYIETGNMNINAIVNMEVQKASLDNVKLECRIAVPKEMPFSEVDMCSLLTNLIDNAIESCLRQKLRNPSVTVMLGCQNESLYISIQNPLAEGTNLKKVLRLESEKSGKTHGFGTKIVANITKKYGGEIKFSAEDNEFTAEALLFFPGEKENTQA